VNPPRQEWKNVQTARMPGRLVEGIIVRPGRRGQARTTEVRGEDLLISQGNTPSRARARPRTLFFERRATLSGQVVGKRLENAKGALRKADLSVIVTRKYSRKRPGGWLETTVGSVMVR
jgi:hypothetical protein